MLLLRDCCGEIRQKMTAWVVREGVVYRVLFPGTPDLIVGRVCVFFFSRVSRVLAPGKRVENAVDFRVLFPENPDDRLTVDVVGDEDLVPWKTWIDLGWSLKNVASSGAVLSGRTVIPPVVPSSEVGSVSTGS